MSKVGLSKVAARGFADCLTAADAALAARTKRTKKSIAAKTKNALNELELIFCNESTSQECSRSF